MEICMVGSVRGESTGKHAGAFSYSEIRSQLLIWCSNLVLATLAKRGGPGLSGGAPAISPEENRDIMVKISNGRASAIENRLSALASAQEIRQLPRMKMKTYRCVVSLPKSVSEFLHGALPTHHTLRFRRRFFPVHGR